MFISKQIYNLPVNLRLFYLQLRDTTDFKRTPELQQTFDRVKNQLTDGTLRLAIPNQKNLSFSSAMLLIMALEPNFSKNIILGKWS